METEETKKKELKPELLDEKYEDGFSVKSVLAALFIGFVMFPGAMYLGLMTGGEIGNATQWVIVLLYVEIAKRTFTVLKRQEIYMLYYIALSMLYGLGMGGPFGSFIYNQFFIQSQQADMFGISKVLDKLEWIVPSREALGTINRTFFHPVWVKPIILLVIGQILYRINWFGLSYVLFRITNDVERLPFPMAPIAAQGATAIADSFSPQQSWRWRVFSTGAMIGLVWGALYVGIPAITNIAFTKPLYLFPIPFADMTSEIGNVLPAALMGWNTDIGIVLVGFVLPFVLVIGMFIGCVLFQIIGNPILHNFGVITQWKNGMSAIPATVANNLDFYLSFGFGTAGVVAALGIYNLVKANMQRKRKELVYEVPKDRGGMPIWLGITLYVVSTIVMSEITHLLAPDFPLWLILIFGFLWTPMFSYMSARMVGITGQSGSSLYGSLYSGVLLVSGYKGIDIWFVGTPTYDHGGFVQRFKELELTKTKFISVVKAEVLIFAIAIVCSFIYWSFIWGMAPIPSAIYAFVAKMWPLQATFQCLWATANQSGDSFLLKAIKPMVMAYGLGGGFIFYFIISLLKLPVALFYGVLAGVNLMPHYVMPLFVGGMLSHFYFRKRFGEEKWKTYPPVLLAGFACGNGLIGMGMVAISLISYTVSKLPF